jgi:hypothetical protein
MRKEYPNEVIHEVLWIRESEFGFQNVKIDMEVNFFDTIIKHARHVLPYPLSGYQNLSEKQKLEWRYNTMFL